MRDTTTTAEYEFFFKRLAEPVHVGGAEFSGLLWLEL